MVSCKLLASECAILLTAISKYLADSNIDVRLATENVLAEFLREIKYIANVQDKHLEAVRAKREAQTLQRWGSKHTMESAVNEAAMEDEIDGESPPHPDADADDVTTVAEEHDWEGEGSGAWVPGQGVCVDHTAIMDIIIQHLSYPGEYRNFPLAQATDGRQTS